MIWLGYILGGVLLSGTIVACLFYEIMKSMRTELKVIKIDLKHTTEENEFLHSQVTKLKDKNFELGQEKMYAESRQYQEIENEVNRLLADERARLRVKERELEIKRAKMRDELELEIYRKITGRLGGNEQ
jgi:hypothetical protein